MKEVTAETSKLIKVFSELATSIFILRIVHWKKVVFANLWRKVLPENLKTISFLENLTAKKESDN